MRTHEYLFLKPTITISVHIFHSHFGLMEYVKATLVNAGQNSFKTRLISIVSKPIEVVVVVVVIVVIVFVKKNRIGPRIFDPKEIPCPKTFDLKVLDPKKIWVKKS